MNADIKNIRKIWWLAFPGGRFYPFQLRAAKSDILHRIGRWKELTSMLQQDLAQAQERDVATHQGRCLLKLGILDAQRGSYAEAGEKTAAALKLYQITGDQQGEFNCRAAMAKIALNLKDYQRTEEITTQLLAEARRKKDLPAESEMLNNMGLLCIETGKSQQGLEYFNQKLELSRNIGDKGDSAQAMGNIGCVHFDQKRWPEAVKYFSDSVKLSQRTGDIYTEYFALYNLAQACEKMGQIEQARIHFQRDLEMARQLGDEPGEQDILEDLARVNAAKTGEGC